MSPRIQKKRILIIPSIKKGNGSGHIRRSIKLAQRLSACGAHAYIFADSVTSRSHDCYTKEDIRQLFPAGSVRKIKILTEAVPSEWDICIFDTRETSVPRLSNFLGRTFTVGIDEGGAAREFFDYLIDVLPNLEKTEPNIGSPGFLNLPEQPPAEKSGFTGNFKNVLVTFGGEDGGGLTERLLEMIDDTGIIRLDQITVVKGPFFRDADLPAEVKILDAPENLAAMLRNYDLVFTLFGLTCFEALYSMTPVVLFNPSAYHRSLSIRAGIPEIGINKPDAAKLDNLLQNTERLFRAVDSYSKVSRMDLADYIMNLKLSVRKCRGCGSVKHKIIYRDRDRSFFQCDACRLVNQMNFGNKTPDYGSEYFFEDYKKQYGRTYLEDFEKIKTDGIRRCGVIRKYRRDGMLLDIGCGYGPFLAAADESGFEVRGIDVSLNAVDWIKNELGYKAEAVSIEQPETIIYENADFNAVTMWYVIEHMHDLPAVLSRINNLLEPGGVFAFSTPNFRGITAKKSAAGFLNKNPLDHYTVWSPGAAKRLLSGYGFRVKSIECPVIHPERFLRRDLYDLLPAPVRKAADFIFSLSGRFFLLGDTFEVYAVKLK